MEVDSRIEAASQACIRRVHDVEWLFRAHRKTIRQGTLLKLKKRRGFLRAAARKFLSTVRKIIGSQSDGENVLTSPAGHEMGCVSMRPCSTARRTEERAVDIVKLRNEDQTMVVTFIRSRFIR